MQIDFQLKYIKQGHELDLTYLYTLTGTCRSGIIVKYQHTMLKVTRKALISGKIWNSVCCHGLYMYCGAPLVELYCRESNISDLNCLRYLHSSYLIKIQLSL